MKIKLHFSNINCENDFAYRDFVALAGYSGSINRLNDEESVLDIGDDIDRASCGITEKEVQQMIASIIMFTSVQVRSEYYF